MANAFNDPDLEFHDIQGDVVIGLQKDYELFYCFEVHTVPAFKTVLREKVVPRVTELALMRRMDELHLNHPYAGSRMLRDLLQREGVMVGRKHVRTLMRRMGIEALYRRPGTSKRHPGHTIYPYLLRHLTIDRANQVWALDTTYVPMARGFVYLTAVIDWASRKVLAHRVAITLEACHAVEVLTEALNRYGAPDIVNTDQGSQFTAAEFTDLVKDRGCQMSMDGRGAWRDNVFVERLWRTVKYEEIVCYERNRCRSGRKRCFTKDEGRPLGVGLQEQASNRHKLLGLRVRVVSVAGKGGVRLRQVGVKETNVSKPLMTCRNVSKWRRNRDPDFCPANEVEGCLPTAQSASGMKAA